MVEIVDVLLNSSASFLITFREALEAALIVGILAAYLKKIGRAELNRYIVRGVLAAIAASIGMGALAAYLYGGLSGIGKGLFEGSSSILAAAILTYMIFWMARNSRRIKGELEEKVHSTVTRGYLIGISLLAFVAVAREGLETVLFLTALATQDISTTLTGLIAGVVLVSGLALLMMKGVYVLDLGRFFKYTSLILLVFAAGLLGYGVHEFVEVAEDSGVKLGLLAISAYNINPPDSSSIFHEKGAVGSIFKALVGYDGNPEWIRVAVYSAYWVVIGGYLARSYGVLGPRRVDEIVGATPDQPAV